MSMAEWATYDFRMRKCARREQQCVCVDWISQLPNEILVYVLSFLSFKDGVRTSVLSKRWIHLWKFVATLDFDASKYLKGVSYPYSESFGLKMDCRKYIKWVNNVLRSHKATLLDVFRICFYLKKSHRIHIDKWLQYAFARKVERIEINLGDRHPYFSKLYAFLPGLLGRRSAMPALKSLKALSFNNVLLSNKVLQVVLQNCPFLEHLVVQNSRSLKSFEVCGQSLALKHLEISYCTGLQSITICNTNIVSLKITKGHRLVLDNVPMLVDVNISGRSSSMCLIRGVVSWLSCCWSKLEALTLRADVYNVEDAAAVGFDFVVPELPKLKQFTLVAAGIGDESLIPFTCFLRASPNLEKFTLELHWWYTIDRRRITSKIGVSFPLRHLKVVEFWGYYGRGADVELVEYCIRNAVVLERIIVDPRGRPPSDQPDAVETATVLAQIQLGELVPPHVELVIL